MSTGWHTHAASRLREYLLQALYYTCNGAFNSSQPVAGQNSTLPLDGSQYNYTLTFSTMPPVTGYVWL